MIEIVVDSIFALSSRTKMLESAGYKKYIQENSTLAYWCKSDLNIVSAEEWYERCKPKDLGMECIANLKDRITRLEKQLGGLQ